MDKHSCWFYCVVVALLAFAGACGQTAGAGGGDASTGSGTDGAAAGGDGALDGVDGAGEDGNGPCPDLSVEYFASSGRRVCCPLGTVLCDEIEEWYPGGCWAPETDCTSILWCERRWQACIPGYPSSCIHDTMACEAPCPAGSVEYESASGRRVCCSEGTHLFCDETDAGYEGGCYELGIDCDTITYCQGDWRACGEGAVPICSENDQFSCGL